MEENINSHLEWNNHHRKQKIIHEVLLSDVIARSQLSLFVETPNYQNEEWSVDQRKSVIRVAQK